jgi:hypothetical protein
MQSNTATVKVQCLNSNNFSVENYKPDPFTVVDGRYVGHDGFVVPKNFDEFHERFPEYVRNWVKRHVDRSIPREDVEDWTHDLLIHLRSLPTISKHRETGMEDVVQTFDPHKHHGSNSARFFNYINLCLGNRFRTMRSKRMKNPLCRPGNLSLTIHWEGTDHDQVGDEFCHSHSEHLRKRCQRQDKLRDDRTFIMEFVHFVAERDLAALPAIEAIAGTGTQGEAAHSLGMATAEFCHSRDRLRNLARCFLNGEPLPRRRRRCGTRLERRPKQSEAR